MAKAIESLDGRTLVLEGNRYLYFSGTSYLGLSTHADFQQSIWEGMQRFGVNYGGSRLSNLQFAVFEEAESYLAEHTGMEAALTFSSGTLAGQLLSRYLSQTHQIHYTPNTHPALWHNKVEKTVIAPDEWVEKILETAHQTSQSLAILGNAIDPLYVQHHDFSWWKDLPKDRKTVIVLDDSHGLGVLGDHGAGIRSQIQVPEQVELIVAASLGKAFAVPGGVILASYKRIQAIKNSPFFGGASPIIPAYLHAFLESKGLHQRQLQKLHSNITFFKTKLNHRIDFRYLSNYPVFYTPNQQLATKLFDKGILISSFPYPTAESDCINRVIINATHQIEDILQLLQAMEN